MSLPMRVLEVEVPEELARALKALVDAGWFASEKEAVRFALTEFVRRHRLELLERFQLDDITWAIEQKTQD